MLERQPQNPQATALATVVATMRYLLTYFISVGEAAGETIDQLESELTKLEYSCSRALPQIAFLSEVRDQGITSTQFQILMVNTIVRVAPSYFEVPANVASAAIHANLQAYGTIVNNANDEAGRGVPKYTHPALLNQTARVLSDVFKVAPITLKTTIAALALKATKSTWMQENDVAGNRTRAKEIAQIYLEVDEFNTFRSAEEIEAQLDVAISYSELIATSSLEFYRERIHNLTQAIAVQGNYLFFPEKAKQGDLALAAQLAVREAAASEPDGFIELFNREIADRYLGYIGEDINAVLQGRLWGDMHVRPELGKIYGYDGHSAEDDHAEQALAALVDRIHHPLDLLHSIQSMNMLNEILFALWEGTVEKMKQVYDPSQTLPPKPLLPIINQQIAEIILSQYDIPHSCTGINR